MNKQEIKKQAQKIEAIHKSYLDQLLKLKNKQDKIITDFSEALKNKKLSKLRKSLETQ